MATFNGPEEADRAVRQVHDPEGRRRSPTAEAPGRAGPRRRGPLAVFTGALGAVAGAAPHVLHHVAPLLGAALIAGAGGTILFAALGFAASAPFLLRLRRRFGTWWAPMVATVSYAAMFTASTLWLAPLISNAVRPDPAPPAPAVTQTDHAAHHPS
ncbi:hypothetical protein [Raineyella sp. W15-4]|uniref:hypothetical protein n=1 Tax=Raineyella sp. W15-4 TaxID=3081651 RepID=UPI002952A36D|nr:hypothetical protein [Raineyella sp. W15-4]WOQ16691.1 hypothetical protein R0145_16020 [Raineyella sp. W15-4]